MSREDDLNDSFAWILSLCVLTFQGLKELVDWLLYVDAENGQLIRRICRAISVVERKNAVSGSHQRVLKLLKTLFLSGEVA